MKKSLIIASLIVTLAPFACKKKEDPAPSKTEILTTKSWKIKSVTMAGVDITSQFFKSCQNDDVTKFLTNGVFTYTDAGVKCDPDGSETGSWAFANNETDMVIDGDTTHIEEINTTLIRTSREESGFKYEITMTAQ